MSLSDHFDKLPFKGEEIQGWNAGEGNMIAIFRSADPDFDNHVLIAYKIDDKVFAAGVEISKLSSYYQCIDLTMRVCHRDSIFPDYTLFYERKRTDGVKENDPDYYFIDTKSRIISCGWSHEEIFKIMLNSKSTGKTHRK